MYYSWPREPDQRDHGSLSFVRALAYIRAVQPSIQLDFTENKARKRNRIDRMLGAARILGVEREGLPDVALLYVELFDFQI